MIHHATTEDSHTSRAALIADGSLEPVDPRMARAFGYRESLAIERHAYDTTVCRPDDPATVDITGRTVDLLWNARIALDAHTWPLRVPFTVWPTQDRPVNLWAERGPGDFGEPTVTITEAPAVPFTPAGTAQELAALRLMPGPRPVPVVTVDVLHVLMAALIDSGRLAVFHVEDAPDNPVTLTLTSGRTGTLRSHRDGSYSVGVLAAHCTTA